MNREKRLLLASLVILAILGLLAVEYLPLAEEDKTELKISWPITDALVNKIDQWVIRGPSEKVRLEKKQEGWLISEPVKTQVNPEKVGNFLKQLHEVSPKKEVRHLEPGVTTGLEEPQFVIQGYSGPKDQVFELRLGEFNKSEQTVYASFARSGGPTLRYALPRLMVFRLGLGLSDLRERRIWAQANSPNTKIRYQRLSRGNAGFTFEAIKNAKVLSHRGSPFRLLKPLSEAADEKRMNQLLSLLSETELKEMVTEAHQDNLQPWGLDKPVYTIALENPNWKSPVTVLMNPVLEAPGTFYVTRSDVLWVGRFASSRFEQLDFDLNGVIDKRLFSFQLQKVRRWEVWDTKLGHLIFEKKRGAFVMLAPQPAMVQETLMYQALKNFAYIEGATLLVKGVTGDVEWQDSKTEKWTTKMTFYDSKDKRLGELTLFENEQGIYGVSSERSETFKMSPQTQKYLPGRIEAWLKQ